MDVAVGRLQMSFRLETRARKVEPHSREALTESQEQSVRRDLAYRAVMDDRERWAVAKWNNNNW
jgi:hypothetical protein